MYEQMTGKKCGGLKIFYLREFDGSTWQEINCNYMRRAVEDVLEHHQAVTFTLKETADNILAA